MVMGSARSMGLMLWRAESCSKISKTSKLLTKRLIGIKSTL